MDGDSLSNNDAQIGQERNIQHIQCNNQALHSKVVSFMSF